MGVSLERVQFKFASIIGELCSEPDILSQFAVWVDLKMAEYKAKGAMSLECSGCKPKPTWMRGVIPPEKAPIPEDDRLTERRTGIGVADDSARQSYSECSDRPSVDERLSPELIIVKDEPRSPNQTFHKNYYSDSTLNSLPPTSRKRYSEEAIGAHSSAKVKRMSSLPHAQSEQNSQANQSLLSVISGGDNENMDEERVSLVNRLLPPAPSAGTFPQSTWQHNQSTFNQADINLVQEDNSNNGPSFQAAVNQHFYQLGCGYPSREFQDDSSAQEPGHSQWEATFRCSVCSYTSQRQYNLKRHMLKHDMGERYKCSLCPAAFVDNYKLKMHFLRKHTDQSLKTFFPDITPDTASGNDDPAISDSQTLTEQVQKHTVNIPESPQSDP